VISELRRLGQEDISMSYIARPCQEKKEGRKERKKDRGGRREGKKERGREGWRLEGEKVRASITKKVQT
jgi:hypothetical protein